LIRGVPGLTISSSLHKGPDANEDGTFFLQLNENESKQMEIILTNHSEKTLELAHCEMMKKCRVFALNDSKKVTDGMGKVKLKPGMHL